MLHTATTDSNGRAVELRVIDNMRLQVKSDTEQQEYNLQYVYGIDKDTIHYCHVTEPEQQQQTGDPSIANFRNSGTSMWERRRLTFQSISDEFIAGFRSLISLNTSTRVSVILNPAAGQRNAPDQWQNIVKPMLEAAGFSDFQMTETKPNGSTRALAEQLGVQMLRDKKETLFLCLGGDGTIHEVVNGLSDAFDHGTWDAAPTYRLGIVPCGSGNALSLSLNLSSVEHGALQVIKGKTQPLRLVDVTLDGAAATTRAKTRILVVMSWGFHAQIVSKSRYLQPFMGNRRFSWVAMFLLMFLRQYAGELTLVDAQRYDARQKRFGAAEKVRRIADDAFTYFLVGKQPSLERGFKIVPFASPASADMDVMVVRGASRDQLKAAMVKVIEGGRHVDEDIVEYYKTPELVLRVKEASEVCLDGEIIQVAAGGSVRLQMIGPSQGEPGFECFV
ncbi:ATP-NAD kinase-like domain-containing protein [Fennellomyces sp. T-0311]|nr:ATP-NAD kinase-like domain-containing protein [Fennellomyces sp. T-0311]